MKAMIITALCTIIFGSVHGQTWDEWFRQKKTQTKYLVQQVAALQVYIGHAKKGYQVVKEGLQTIGGNSGKEFNLHTEHLHALTLVNPEIKKDPKFTEILDMRNRIIFDYHINYRQFQNSNAFVKEELDYIMRVYNRVLADCQDNIDQLMKTGTSGILNMTDAERIQRLEELHAEMRENYEFSKSFSNQTKMLAISRIKEKQEIQISREMNGIKSK